MKKILLSLALLVVMVAGIMFAVTRNSPAAHDADKLQVAASYYPLYDFAKAVGGNKVQVANITPAGAEPHDYEPSPKTLTTIQQAAVFVYNGGRLEPWVTNFLHDYRHTAVKASQGIPLLTANDPHFWLDPVLAQNIVNNIRDGFSQADPANKAYYVQNAAAYNTKLSHLDNDFQHGLANCRLHTVISSHDAFSYLGKRYGITVAAIAGLSPDDEPSAARLAAITQLVRTQHVGYVFFESLVSPKLAATIATETGAKTLVFDPVEGLTDADQKQGKNYLNVQRKNLQNLRTALACQ